MAKIIPCSISKNEREKFKQLLCAKVAKINSKGEIMNFFDDLLTESELVMIIRRLEIAKMLIDNFSYHDIRKEIGVGFSTIKSIRHKLDKSRGGYLKFIKQIKI